MRPALVWVCMVGALGAQTQRMPEQLSSWLYYKDLPPPVGGRLGAFLLDRDMLDKSQTEHADVRLYDASGKEIPYVLRVLRSVETEAAYPAREYNRGAEGGAAQISCDLGEQPLQHNQVEIDTTGDNFRRSADVQGSSDGNQWSTLVSGAILFRFTAEGRTVDQQAVAYPVSRYRYLRIRVSRDPQTDRAEPQIRGVRVRRRIERQGETVTIHANTEGRDADRVDGRPASIYRMDFGGRIPLEKLSVLVGEGAFARPFQLDSADDPSSPAMLASGEMIRREDGSRTLSIPFPERFARRLKLTVIDDRNTPLMITSIEGESAAREVIFEAAAAGSGALRIYYGNPRAIAPHYDLAARLPEEPTPPPVRLPLGPQRDNPVYRPEPKPLSERSPWLVYLVLSAAAVVLGAILLSLVRTSARRAPAQ